ncbi:CpaF family protein [Paenibacillus polymyxa]|uniref:Secretion system protein E n=1 Tax=Paenibacillus polymyxa (strain SC2) TaxID=886882 RepID=E3EKT8_PAEPS|nr:ATPase, T2SS/T4P/T4SS family [Paenibacillus polymyxa]ADO59539.1 secretion system protein E [Paenibacillus polymyxa SC2]WPQ59628.1 ATPase, T2SS/T4P/T4SS family [Paenibacillus polymyxa]
MEQSFHSFRRDLAKFKNAKQEGSVLLTYEEALEEVRTKLGEKLENIFKSQGDITTKSDKPVEENVKDKEFLRKKISMYRDHIADIVHNNNIRVRQFEGTNEIERFIDEMAQEFAGYSILSKAFADPGITDIYVIRWNKIFVEKDGMNMKYPYTFRNPKHLKDTIERFLREAGKAINDGDQKIVDFELFGDRGCATSKKVSPKDYSMTIRKHNEDQITKEHIVKNGVLNEELADLLGLLITGESNLIYAGITGSGKTTTIRALLDHYVTKANKRMLVCEDTQELFPQNEHTLELVSVKSDDESLRVTLGQLIITALRLKPKYIIVGEVRGEEAQAAVEGMETGHSTIFTMHGGNPWNIINRLVTKYLMAMPSLGIDVVERIIGSSLDYIAIQDNIPGTGRKCTSLSEVTYNFETRRIELKPIYKYDFRTKEFKFENKISREKADMMMSRGVAWDQLEPWVEDERVAA